MKILFLADAHIGSYKEFDVNGSRLDRCLVALRQVLVTCVSYDIEVVVDCGDLIDRKNLIDLTTYNKIFRFFRDEVSNLQWYSLVGNHNISGVSGETNLEPLSQFIQVINEPISLSFEFGTLSFIPYMKTVEQWREAYNSFDANPTRDILIAHQEVKGAVAGTHRYVAGSGVNPNKLDRFKYHIFGHYHAYQHLNKNSFYCGALLQQGFGEIGNPQGFWVYDTEAMAWQWFQVTSPQFKEATDESELNGYDFFRFRVPEDIEIESPNIRVEVTPNVEKVDRLNVAGNIDGMIQRYIQEKAPPHLIPHIQHVLTEVGNEKSGS